jgi:2-(1,2-epoxy-1,2-dihydrophenyl)acetyl-CoA isomerase
MVPAAAAASAASSAGREMVVRMPLSYRVLADFAVGGLTARRKVLARLAEAVVTMTDAPLLRTQHGGVLTLALNRPDKLNACTPEMTEELADALLFADQHSSVRCVILSGVGRGFCSGQDLDVFRDRYTRGERIDVAAHLRAGYNVVAMRMRSLPKPIIASINGIAAGVGLSLALCADIRVAAEDARFTLGFSRIGLIPDGGASFMLPLIVGLGHALELAMTSDRIGAAEAHRIGLVNRVVPTEQLQAETSSLAEQLAAMPASALALTKRAFNRSTMPGFAGWLDEEADLQQEASENPDHLEGVMAFLQKRSPVYSGR